jgi:hypothetical protein
MNISMHVGWMFGFGFMGSKEGIGLFLPVVMIFVEFKGYRWITFNFENNF